MSEEIRYHLIMKIEINKADNGWIATVNGNKVFVADTFMALAKRLNREMGPLKQDKEVGVKVGIKKISRSK